LQRGLVPEDKTTRVANYQRNMVKEVSVIAHSCGVAHPRLLRRHHARLVLGPNRSVSLEDYYKHY